MTTTTLAPSRTIFHLRRNDNGRFILLGYSLNLTHREHQILSYIFENHQTPIPCDDITKAVGGMSLNNLTVFINMINKKAHAIGGRKLILCHRGVGYYLNEYM